MTTNALPGGLLLAAVSPFLLGRLDFPSLFRLLDGHLDRCDGLVIAGTTGEISTLTGVEYETLLRESIDHCREKTCVIIGTGSNDTRTALERTRLAQKLGAHGVQVVAPYYNRPSQAGLLAHFTAVAQSTDLPVMLYSIKSRCGVEIDLETVCRLRDTCPNVLGIKEASTDCRRIMLLRSRLGDDFRIYAGDDEMILPFLACGADGAVSCMANLLSRPMGTMIRLALANDFRKAHALQLEIQHFLEVLRCDVNPVPIKWAACQIGWIASPEVRLPLVELAENDRRRLADILDLFPKDWQ